LLQTAHEPNQNSEINARPDNDPTPIRSHYLDPPFSDAHRSSRADGSRVTIAGIKGQIPPLLHRQGCPRAKPCANSEEAGAISLAGVVAAVRRGPARLSCTIFSFSDSAERRREAKDRAAGRGCTQKPATGPALTEN